METIEKIIARQLLDVKAVQLNAEKPFTWASGWRSPIYCDNRKALSFPKVRETIYKNMADVISENYSNVEVIAGVATGAISWGVLAAEYLNKPFIYVRPKPKGHGTGARIEGCLPESARVVVVEDLVSTGGSSLSAVDCLTAEGANVLGMVAIFTYNFDVARHAFEKSNCELRTLTDYDALIDEALACDYISEAEIETIRQWRFDPGVWGR